MYNHKPNFYATRNGLFSSIIDAIIRNGLVEVSHNKRNCTMFESNQDISTMTVTSTTDIEIPNGDAISLSKLKLANKERN